MTTSPVYSARLGAISEAQFDGVLRRAGLGRFVSAEAAPGGLFGQNVFLTSTQGAFVFRGAPHWHDGARNDAWQFPKERLYADLLHAHTNVPVAWPQILDDSCEDFDWPCLLAPRLPGLSLARAEDRAGLTEGDFLEVARAMGEALAGLQALTWDFAGDFDPATAALAPYAGGAAGRLAGLVGLHARSAAAHGALTGADQAWLEDLLAADPGRAEPRRITFAHNDYSLGNVLFERADGGWRVSGVIDLMTCDFGDPAADLVRQACGWLDTSPPCAAAFLGAYRRAGGAADPSPARLAVLTALERLQIWDYFTGETAPDIGLRGRGFRSWLEPYILGLGAAWFEAV